MTDIAGGEISALVSFAERWKEPRVREALVMELRDFDESREQFQKSGLDLLTSLAEIWDIAEMIRRRAA